MPAQRVRTLAPFVYVVLWHGLGLEVHRQRVVQAQAEIDELRPLVLIAIPARAGAEGAKDGKSGTIKIAQDKHLLDEITELVEQHPGRRHTHSLVAHQRDVEALLQ